MAGSGYTTVPGAASEFGQERALTTSVPTLVVVGHPPDPSRIGQACSLDLRLGQEALFGRADEKCPESSLRAALMHFSMVRPGSVVDCGPLAAIGISHEQGVFRGTAIGIDMEHVGRTDVVVNGAPMARGERLWIRDGDVIHFAKHSTLVMVMAPAMLPADPYLDVSHPFGQADAHGIVGESPVAWDLRGMIVQARRAGGNVLVLGESGTGKELVARAIHAQSGRKGPFVPVNAATLGANLADSSLFGNVAHYPEQKTPARPGYFGEADGGTLFLDEFGELPDDLQAKLLRALQTGGEHMRLGSSRPEYADVLVIAATNRPPARIRLDLLSRFPSRIDVPPLTARVQDVALLVQAIALARHRVDPQLVAPFLGARPDGTPYVRIAAPFEVALTRAHYAANVREIENLVVRGMVQSRGDAIALPSGMPPARASTPPPPRAREAAPAPAEAAPPPLPSPDDTLRDGVPVGVLIDGLHDDPAPRASNLSKDTIRAALSMCRGKVAPAARHLTVHRDALRRQMKKLGIEAVEEDE